MNLLPNDFEDEEYIDMEVGSYSNFFCNSMRSPPHPREFEFQLSSGSMEREPTTSPADELFYKGKLLPLHLPPRLQMVEKLLQNSSSVYEDRRRKEDNFEEFYSTPLATSVTTPTTTSTPYESCNITPSESCNVSRELNPEEYFFEYSTEEVNGCNGENQKKSWTKKLKQSSIGSKLKASRAYLKSLFGKSGCSNESCAAAKVADEGSVSKAKERLEKYMKSTKKLAFGQIYHEKNQISTAVTRSTYDKEKMIDQDNANRHRRSFSFAIRRHSTNKTSSSSSLSSGSSSSSNSNASQYLQFLKRSSSVNAEIESPIQGAIAHCKQSQCHQNMRSRKTVSEVGFYSLSASSISAVCDDQEKPDLLLN